MTQRKPPGLPFESWVDRQIREATERGEFADLPGAGKPLQGEGKPYDEMWWVKEKMEREHLSYLPPSLALRKEAQDARSAALEAASEPQLRRIVAAVNAKIEAALRTPLEGPPLNLRPLDVEELAREWRRSRAA
jgi:DnaJ-like protein